MGTPFSASRTHGHLAIEIAQNVPLGYPDFREPKGSPLERRAIRVSELQQCPRLLCYKWRGHPETNAWDATTREKIEKGNVLQDRVRGVIIPRYSGYLVIGWQPEIRLSIRVDEVNLEITGHPDGFLYDPNAGKIVSVLECKATSDWAFQQMCSGCFSNENHYSATYLHQANCYAAMWNLTYPTNPIQEFTLFIYNVGGKEDKEVGAPYKDFWFSANPKAFQEDVIQAATHFQHVESDPNWVPDRAYDHNDWHCTGCTHHDLCYGIVRADGDSRGPAGPAPVVKSLRKGTRRTLSRRSTTTAKRRR